MNAFERLAQLAAEKGTPLSRGEISQKEAATTSESVKDAASWLHAHLPESSLQQEMRSTVNDVEGFVHEKAHIDTTARRLLNF